MVTSNRARPGFHLPGAELEQREVGGPGLRSGGALSCAVPAPLAAYTGGAGRRGPAML